MTAYWIYKNSLDGGPAGYWGDWLMMVFNSDREEQWGGSYSTRSPIVARFLDQDVAKADVIVAYQTDLRSVVGFCVVTRVTGPPGDRKLYLKPIERLAQPAKIHALKKGMSLDGAWSLRSPLMLNSLTSGEMRLLVQLRGAPARVLAGKAASNGYRP